MAILDSSTNVILGKVGDLVYYKADGKIVVRSRPKLTVPPTPAQILNREKFKRINKLFLTFKETVRFSDENPNKSVLFQKYNKDLFKIVNGKVVGNIEEVKLSDSSFSSLTNLKTNQLKSKIDFKWENDGLLNKSLKVVAWAYSKKMQKVLSTESLKKDLSCSIPIPPGFQGKLITGCFVYR